MGCWAETDGITQLPINCGDKVRVFVILHQDSYPFHEGGEGGGGTCYSNDRWSPLGPAIQGKYNDYGGVEDIVYDDNAKMVETILRSGWVQPKTSHEWDKVPELDKMKLEDFLEFIERDRGKADCEHRGVKHLGLMMVLEEQNELEIYQAIIAASIDIIEAREKRALEDGGDPKDENGYTPYMIEHNAKQVPTQKT